MGSGTGSGTGRGSGAGAGVGAGAGSGTGSGAAIGAARAIWRVPRRRAMKVGVFMMNRLTCLCGWCRRS